MTERFETPIKRRDFLGISAFGAFCVAMGAALAGMLRLPKPTLLPEPSRRYKIGAPATIRLGEQRSFEGRSVYVFHGVDGFHAMSSICTHLGCIVKETKQGFECPCHGSRFTPDGKVVSGPAPRALEWFEVSMAPDGELVVDENIRIKPGTYFKV